MLNTRAVSSGEQRSSFYASASLFWARWRQPL
jgi:hypothetical protein